jgi:hypothetical protein
MFKTHIDSRRRDVVFRLPSTKHFQVWLFRVAGVDAHQPIFLQIKWTNYFNNNNNNNNNKLKKKFIGYKIRAANPTLCEKSSIQ